MKLSSPFALIKKSIEIFFEKKNLVKFVKIYLPLLPFALFSIWQTNVITSQAQLQDPRTIITVGFFNIGYLVVYLWIWIAGVISIKLIINNSKFIIKDIYKTAWGMVWKFSLLSLVLMLIYLGGLILLIIPALIFGIWYSFSKFIFIGGGTVKESLTRSKNLVKGKFWAILGRYIIFGMFTGLFGILMTIIPFGIGGVVTTIFGALFVLPYYLLYLELGSAYKKS